MPKTEQRYIRDAPEYEVNTFFLSSKYLYTLRQAACQRISVTDFDFESDTTLVLIFNIFDQL